MWMLYIYLFATALLPEKGHAMLAAAASSVFLFLTYQVPIIAQSIGHFTFPLVFYLYFMSLSQGGLKYRLPFIALLLGMPLTHPVTALLLLFMLLALELVRLVYIRISKPAVHDPATGAYPQFNISAPLIVFIVLFIWISASLIFDWQVRGSYRALTGQHQVEALSELGATQHISTSELFQWILRGYGHLLIFMVVAAVGVLMLVSRIRRGRRELIFLLLFFIAAFAGELFLTFLNVALGQEALYYRSLLMGQLVYFSPIVVGFALFELLKRLDRRALFRAYTVVVVLGLAWVVSFFALFPSPWTYQRSIQITRMEVDSHRWFFSQERLGYIYTGLNVPHGITTIVLLYSASDESMYVQRSAGEMSRGLLQYRNIPPHFGQEQGRRWGEIVSYDIAFFMSDRFTKALTHPVLSRSWIGFLERRDFTLQDIDNLKFDPTVDKLYSNGPVSLLFVRVTRD